MHRIMIAALVASLFLVAVPPAHAGGNANFLFGTRRVGSEDFWGAEQDQTVAGVIVDFGKDHWPIHLSLANMGSDNDGAREGQVSEYSVGVMKVWGREGILRPFVGGGLAVVQAAFVFDVNSGDLVRRDTSPGLFVDGGLFWRTGERFNIGIGARFMTLTSVEIAGVEGDADYLQVHVLAGFGWPKRERSQSAPTTP